MNKEKNEKQYVLFQLILFVDKKGEFVH